MVRESYFLRVTEVTGVTTASAGRWRCYTA